jgi:hypothetical protein
VSAGKNQISADQGAVTLEAATARRDAIERQLTELGVKLASLTSAEGQAEDIEGVGAKYRSYGGAGVEKRAGRLIDDVEQKRRAVLYQMRGLYAELEQLRTKVAQANSGELPSWWRSEINCGGCPSAADVEARIAAERQ